MEKLALPLPQTFTSNTVPQAIDREAVPDLAEPGIYRVLGDEMDTYICFRLKIDYIHKVVTASEVSFVECDIDQVNCGGPFELIKCNVQTFILHDYVEYFCFRTQGCIIASLSIDISAGDEGSYSRIFHYNDYTKEVEFRGNAGIKKSLHLRIGSPIIRLKHLIVDDGHIRINGWKEQKPAEIQELEISDCSIDKGGVYVSHFNSARLQCFNVAISKGAVLSCDQLKINQFTLAGISGEGLVRMTEIEVKELCDFAAIDVAAFSLSRCNFRKAMINVDNVRMKDMWYTDVSFPKDVDKYNLIGRLHNVLGFAGLMAEAAKKVGDVSGALQWHNLILRIQTEVMPWAKFQDKLILKLSSLISDHGNSWARPIGALIILGAVLFPLQLMIAESSFYSSFNLEVFLSRYLEFLYPLRDYNYMDLDEPRVEESFWYRLIDYVSRVFQGLIIYQFVKATRKFVPE